MSKNSDVILQQHDGAVCWISLNRPERLNTVTPELYEALYEKVAAAGDDPDVRCVVLTGAGKAFCAGRDLKQPSMPAADSSGAWLERRQDYLRRHVRIAHALHEMPKPTIAMINGACAGAGLSFAGACDLRIASTDALLTSAFIKAGLSGDMGGTWFWTRILGSGKARRLYLLSERFNAQEAEAFGLVDKVVPAKQLRQTVAEIANDLVTATPQTLRYAKAALNAAEDSHLEAILEFEAMVMAFSGIDAAARSGEIRQGSDPAD